MKALRVILIALSAGLAGQSSAAELAEFDGFYMHTPLRSLFYPRADCTRDPYWVTRDRGVQLERYLGVGPNDGSRAFQTLRVRFKGLLVSQVRAVGGMLQAAVAGGRPKGPWS